MDFEVEDVAVAVCVALDAEAIVSLLLPGSCFSLSRYLLAIAFENVKIVCASLCLGFCRVVEVCT